VSIRLLGGFGVQLGARRVADSDWRLQKARALVKLLALAPRHRLAREEVTERLWPDVDPQAALNSLYYALHVARQALDGSLCDTQGQSSLLQLVDGVLAFAPSTSISVDVETFQMAASAARHSNDSFACAAALDLYAGELLPEDRYQDWAARPREKLRAMQLQLLEELAHIHQTRGEYVAAVGALSRLVAEEPAHEEARVSLMRLHVAAGQRQQALREYAQLRTALHEELDVEPEATTQQLYAGILAGRGTAEVKDARLATKIASAPTRALVGSHEIANIRRTAPRIAWSR
jgi:DNA-binding SARP family transcriptional activator